VLSDDVIEYYGGLGLRFNKMVIGLESIYDIKLFIINPTKIGNRNTMTYSNTTVYNIFNTSVLQHRNDYHDLKQLYTLSGLGIIEILREEKWMPDIVLVTDYVCILAGKYISTIYNSKFIVEFDVALFSYEKIYNQNELSESNKLHSYIIKDIERLGCQDSDLVIMCSEYYKNTCPYIKHVQVVENGITIEEFDNVNELFHFPHSQPNVKNIVYIGRLNTQKGIDLIMNTTYPSNVNVYLIYII